MESNTCESTSFSYVNRRCSSTSCVLFSRGITTCNGHRGRICVRVGGTNLLRHSLTSRGKGACLSRAESSSLCHRCNLQHQLKIGALVYLLGGATTYTSALVHEAHDVLGDVERITKIRQARRNEHPVSANTCRVLTDWSFRPFLEQYLGTYC